MRRVSTSDVQAVLQEIIDDTLANFQREFRFNREDPIFVGIESLVTSTSMTTEDAIRLAFNMGEHRGASNPYC